jgi:3-phosphoshikimate 1-carboxyvinyltransferase
MKKSINPSLIEGEISAPPSKSLMQRMTAAALLAEGKTTEIWNPSYSADCLASLNVAQTLGAEVTLQKDRVVIRGGLAPSVKECSCGESGLCVRMFTPIASLWPGELILHGEATLLSRPMGMMEAPLRDLGVRCMTHNGYPPIKVHGPLKGGKTKVDGSISSQFLTGLLMALPMAEGDSELLVQNLTSASYIDMTLKVLESCGIHIRRKSDTRFFIQGKQIYFPRAFTVEGDWSGAAFMLVAAAVGGQVSVKGLDQQSSQPDRKICEILRDVGSVLRFHPDAVYVRKAELRSFDFDVTGCPDLVPPLVALACSCQGKSLLRGVERLRYKETDRLSALQKELSKLGIETRILDGALEIQGGKIWGGVVDSHADHRIAMALAVLAINAEQPLTVKNADCVNKSYPEFFEDLASIGGKIDE